MIIENERLKSTLFILNSKLAVKHEEEQKLLREQKMNTQIPEEAIANHEPEETK